MDHRNFKKILQSPTSVDCYTTLEDLDIKLDKIPDLVNAVNKVCLIDLDENFVNVVSDGSIYLYLNFFRHLVPVESKVENFSWYKKLNKDLFTNLADTRKSNETNLWITGCSFTYGVGVEKEQRYASIIEKKLNLPTTMLVVPGSTIAWQADQLLQSDIRSGDMVLWGLTSFNRINIANGYSWDSYGIVDYINCPRKQQYWNIDYFNSLTQSTPYIKNILQVINLCKKINAELYLVNLLETTWVDFLFNKEKNYLNLTTEFNPDGTARYLDLGTDNMHPGPLQHQEYASKILTWMEEKHKNI